MKSNLIELTQEVGKHEGLSISDQSFLRKMYAEECKLNAKCIESLSQILCSPNAGELERVWARAKLDNILVE